MFVYGVFIMVVIIFSLLDMDLIDFLFIRCGPVTDDYFRETSCNRFVQGEINSIARGEYSIFNEGLYCHHIEQIHLRI